MNVLRKEIYGMSVGVISCLCVFVTGACALNVLPTDLIGAMSICLVLGLLFGWLGDWIPIWNSYFGGGAILAYFGAAVLVKMNMLPDKTVTSVINFIGGYNFLTVFIAVLITGSIMSVNRKTLIRAISGYIPAILAGIAGAMVFGVLGGMVVGVGPGKTLMMYVLPIMGGGTGAGALPMSEIFASTTGGTKGEFLSFAMPILAIGNVFAIFFGALLNKLGEVRPELSGNGELVRGDSEDVHQGSMAEAGVTSAEIGMGFLAVFGLYMAAVIISKKILPSIGGIQIHRYAYVVLLAALCNIFNVFSVKTVGGLQRLQKFFVAPQILMIIMFSCGVAYIDVDQVIAALTLSNVFVTACIVLGSIVGSASCGYLFKFYPIDTAITAGLCMANTGGTGDIAVLSASKRMNLISFDQISSRIWGGIMLVVGSVVFAVFGK